MLNTRFPKLFSVVLSLVMATVLLDPLTAFAISCRKDYFNKDYTLTGNMAEDVVIVAKAQKGRTGAQFGYTEAWCDEFVADCLENAGADSSIVGHGGTVADFEAVMRGKGAIAVNSPQTGDLIFFTKSHVEIVTRVEDGVVYCIGGNNGGTGNYKTNYSAGERRASSVGTARLYLRPNYPSVPKPKWYDGLTPVNFGDNFYGKIKSQYAGWYFTADNGNVNGQNIVDGNYQIWKFERQSDNSYKLINLVDTGCLDVSNYAKDGNGTNVQMWTDNGESAQRFYFYEMYGAYYMRSACSDFAIDMDMNNYPGNVAVYDFGKDWSPQKFEIEKIDLEGNLPVNIGDNFYAKIKNQYAGWYFSADNANVNGQNAVDGNYQIWKFERQTGNSYKLINLADTGCLDVSNYAKDGNGTNVQMWTDNGESAQRFYFYEMYGAYYIKPLCTNLVIDMDMNNYPGNVAVWDFGKDWSPQKFEIEKVDPNAKKEGDINSDSKVNTADIVALKKYLINKESLTEAQFQTADLNQDGKVNIYDFILLKKMLLQK